MFGIRTFLMGAVIGGGAASFAHRCHVVQTADGLVVVSRTHPAQLRSTYVDIREWAPDDWSRFPELAEAVTAEGRTELMIPRPAQAPVMTSPFGPAASGEAAVSSTAAPAARPAIVFQRPVVPTPGAAAARSPAPYAAPAPAANPAPATAPRAAQPVAPPLVEDDSLLGQLARQLESGSARTIGSTESTMIQERPLLREVPGIAPPVGAPVRPATSPQPPLIDDRAALPPQPRPQDLLPSIHAASLQRISNELLPPPSEPAPVGEPSAQLEPAAQLQPASQMEPAATPVDAIVQLPSSVTLGPSVASLIAKAAAIQESAPIVVAAARAAVVPDAAPPTTPAAIAIPVPSIAVSETPIVEAITTAANDLANRVTIPDSVVLGPSVAAGGPSRPIDVDALRSRLPTSIEAQLRSIGNHGDVPIDQPFGRPL